MRQNRHGSSNRSTYNLVSVLESTFKDRILKCFRLTSQEEVNLNIVEKAQKKHEEILVTQEMDAFLNQRKDIKERIYFNKDKRYSSDQEMAQDVNDHIDYVAQELANSPAAQKELIKGSFRKMKNR